MVREHTTSCMSLYKSKYYILYDFLLKFNLNKISEILSEGKQVKGNYVEKQC